ncbi:MAG: hypothetical protein FWC71_04525 [Defluviitaleaceae bacterium]|nr:hypothetical protein [Defluviitaleaceae bacterium]
MLTSKIKRERIKNFFANAVVFLVLFSLFVGVYVMLGDGVPWVYLLLAIPFAGLYGVRSWAKRKDVFLGIHGGVLILPFILFNAWPLRLLVGAFALLCAIYSIRARTYKEWRPGEKSVFMMLGILGVVYFLVSFVFGANFEDLERFFFATAMVVMSATVLVLQMDNIDHRIANLPEKLRSTTSLRGILSFNNRLISIFLGSLMLLGALSLFSHGIWRFVRWGGHGISAIVLFLFGLPGTVISIFVREGVEPYHGDIPIGQYWQDWGGRDDLPEEVAESISIAYNRLMVATHILFGILLLFVLTVGIYLFINNLLKRFHKKNKIDEDESLIPDDATGRLKFFFGDLAAFLPRFASLSRHKVRRAFAKKVNRHIKKGVPIFQSDTPDIIANKIRPTENIDDLTTQYEEVRYGPEVQ